MMKPKSVLADMIVENTSSTPLWEILVATVSNSGRPFTVRRHSQWDAMVKQSAGGLGNATASYPTSPQKAVTAMA